MEALIVILIIIVVITVVSVTLAFYCRRTKGQAGMVVDQTGMAVQGQQTTAMTTGYINAGYPGGFQPPLNMQQMTSPQQLHVPTYPGAAPPYQGASPSYPAPYPAPPPVYSERSPPDEEYTALDPALRSPQRTQAPLPSTPHNASYSNEQLTAAPNTSYSNEQLTAAPNTSYYTNDALVQHEPYERYDDCISRPVVASAPEYLNAGSEHYTDVQEHDNEHVYEQLPDQ